MAQLSAFDVLGPNMIGPSSSHTAGAAVIAYLAQKMINGPIIKATFTLYGSFGESLGGGKVRISRINNVEVEFTGEYSSVIVVHQDQLGLVAHITAVLSHFGVNIAFMRLFRESKGQTAYTLVEVDGDLPKGIKEMISDNHYVHDVMIIEP